MSTTDVMLQHGVRIFIDRDGFEVWIGVEGANNIINAHCIGAGATRELAIAEAEQHLLGLSAVLQTPGVIPEFDVRPQPVTWSGTDVPVPLDYAPGAGGQQGAPR